MDQEKLDSDVSERKQSTQTSKKRKVIEKTVVRVRVGANSGKLKNEGPPSDFWSWRKYGQKPIKGSPFPSTINSCRGYYRCSTSKGCSAKKMVERCRTDSSMLIITYTSTHNHPGPDIHNSTNLNPQEEEEEEEEEEEPKPQSTNQDQPVQDQEVENQNQPTLITSVEDASENHNFHYMLSPIRGSEDIIISQENPFAESQEKTEQDTLSVPLDEEPISCQRLMTLPTPKSEENDFFDELEELPTYSAFRSLMRSSFFDERIPVVPS